MEVIDRSSPEEWFELRFDLSNYLLDYENAPSEKVEEAISILNDLLNEIEKHQEAEKWAMVNLGLGYAYDKRVKGDKQKNLEKVIEYYKRALMVFDNPPHPLIVVTLDLIYAPFSDPCSAFGSPPMS